MKVYLCYETYYDYVEQWERIVKVVSDERKAIQWLAEFETTDQQWRSYEGVEVE